MESKMIDVTTMEGSFGAYASIPESPKKVAVIILQEIFGVNVNIRAIVDSYAADGYAAAAPDLYWRQAKGIELDPASEDGRTQAMGLMKTLVHDQAVADGAATLDALRQLVPGLDRSCAIGFCYGGAIAFLMGARGAVDAGVSYYGTGLHALLSELDAPQGTLLIQIAGDDHLCPPEAQAAIKNAAAKVSGKVRVEVHPGVGHAFARSGGATFNAEAASRANGLTKELLETLAALA